MSHILFQNFKLFHHHFRVSFAHEEQNAVKMKNTNKSDAENISALVNCAFRGAHCTRGAKVLKVPTPTLLRNVQVSWSTRFSFCSLARVRRLIALASCHSGKKIEIYFIYSVWLIMLCTRCTLRS
jgi:hypothetical protein